ncbi:MAG: SLC13 family permease [Planctomycetota bacterium]
MTLPAVYVLALAVLAVVLLATEKAHLSVIGVGMVLAVALPGLIGVEDALAGLANPAVVTVAALYVVGEGFLRTGAATMVANRILERTGAREWTVVCLVMLMSAGLSAFVNNTLVVVTLMPVITSICTRTGLFPSRMLIPLSFASILGGMCTLVGTSTTLLVHGVLLDLGRPGLGMFEITPAGVVLAAVGLAYLGFAGRRMLPRVPSLAVLAGAQNIKEYVTEITVGRGSSLIGKPVASVGETATPGVTRPVMLIRKETMRRPPFRDEVILEGDSLVVSGSSQDLAVLQRGAAAGAASPDRYDPATMSFFELAPTPGSGLVGRRIRDLGLKSLHDVVVVALMRRGAHLRDRLGNLRLQSGDVLLAFGSERAKARLRRSHDVHLIEGVHEEIFHVEKAAIAFLGVALVLTLFVTGLVDTSLAALAGALFMVVTRCLSVREAHNAVNWPIILFVAGTLALSKALVATGGAAAIAAGLADSLGRLGPRALVAGTFLVCIVLTEMLSNNAVAIMMTPIAVAMANSAGVSDRPLVLAVALGASCSFANPMGYKTNLLVFGAGGYRFRNFVAVGLPLDLLLAVTGALLIPALWPL